MNGNALHRAILPDRGVLRITGDDATKLLDGIFTCDLARVTLTDARLGALLSPQGKILFDFLMIAAPDSEGGGYYLDCAKSIVADFAKRLNFYKLRAKLDIRNAIDDYLILAEWGDVSGPAGQSMAFADPRTTALGRRIILQQDKQNLFSCNASADDYQTHRIARGVPEGGLDFAFGDAFPHEVLMDQLHGVDFDKGCYVGQEVVSRMQHRGTARTRMMMAALETPVTLDLPVPILAGEKTVGELRSLAGYIGLALVRLDRVSEAMAAGQTLTASGQIIRIKKPAFARFDFPVSTQAATKRHD